MKKSGFKIFNGNKVYLQRFFDKHFVNIRQSYLFMGLKSYFLIF